jgi:2'-5' RNA ligase
MIDPRSDKTEGYHLFFEPAGAASEMLTNVMGNLAAEYGGPVFAPHLTLLATIPEDTEELLVQKAQLLAENLRPFTLTLNGFGAENTYFRTLYMTVQNAEEVAEYHHAARDMFGGEDASAYMPHVSLLYGLYYSDRKQDTISSLATHSPLSFDVASLALWHTPGDTTTWRRVGEYRFGNAQADESTQN